MSELEWEVDSFSLSGDFWLLADNFAHSQPADAAQTPSANLLSAPFVRLWGGYGFIYDGDNRDSDYSGDNRTGEYSRTENTADDGHVYDIAGAIGWELTRQVTEGATLTVAPFAGYGYSVQKLTITDGEQVIASPPATPPVGPIAGLDSTYSTEWYGPLVGVNLRYAQRDSLGQDAFALWVEGLFQWVDYQGEGEWNLRTDLDQEPSFKHWAQGDGWTVSGGGAYFINSQNLIGADLSYSKWTADEEGDAEIYYANGATASSEFNEAEWEAWSISLHYDYRF